MKTMTVTGSGRVSASPDTVELSVRLETLREKYEDCMQAAAEEIELLRGAAERAGRNREELKTEHFDVSSRYENERQSDGTGRSVFRGFVCTHTLVLRFPFESKTLQRVLGELENCGAHAGFHVRFTVRDGERLADEAVASAVADAVRRAERLAAAGGVKLGPVVEIQYGSRRPSAVSPTQYSQNFDAAPQLMRCAASVELSPEDVEHTEQVTVVWKME